MDVCHRFFCVCVVLCRQRPCDRADHPSKESTGCVEDAQIQIASDGKQATQPNTRGLVGRVGGGGGRGGRSSGKVGKAVWTGVSTCARY
jgi:hypothetical protein